ncbi:MAG: Na+:solute symporter [Ignavibacteriales bacterium]|nr:MAG: Na+:solute symporter [Ignavibacteriales bacterium]
MEIIDYLILIIYFILSISIALYYSKRSGKSTDEFFLSGRKLPWYLAGLSMVATTFAADTPLAVTELVAKNGIAGNWLWWNFAFGGLLTVFFFARLWRRAGIMTEAEFAEIRYSGKPGRFLRGFRALYLGLFINLVIMGWVNKAMASILHGMFGVPESEVLFYVFGCMLLVAVYSALSGLWGVVVTDSIQFFIAMTGCIILAVIVVSSDQVGGISGLQQKLAPEVFNFFPVISVENISGTFALTAASFLAYVGIIWWASWYPGAEPGGGGYVAQRMMSAKNEKHSLMATLLFQVAHYAVRPWPWILVGISSLVLYPELSGDQKGLGFIYAMKDFLPAGLKGLLVAAFFAAYMSTIATQLNWGTSYIINDFYRRFINRNSEEKKYVGAARIVTVLLMALSIIVTLFIKEISGAWQFLMECGAGLGLVLILRWYWWRINAWSEISAMITPFIVYYILQVSGVQFPYTLFYLVIITTIVWIAVTFLTKPVDSEVLFSFYRKIHPGGILWKKISDQLPDVKSDQGISRSFVNWILGVILVYSILFGTGYLILGNINSLLISVAAALLCGAVIYRNIMKLEA